MKTTEDKKREINEAKRCFKKMNKEVLNEVNKIIDDFKIDRKKLRYDFGNINSVQYKFRSSLFQGVVKRYENYKWMAAMVFHDAGDMEAVLKGQSNFFMIYHSANRSMLDKIIKAYKEVLDELKNEYDFDVQWISEKPICFVVRNLEKIKEDKNSIYEELRLRKVA